MIGIYKEKLCDGKPTHGLPFAVHNIYTMELFLNEEKDVVFFNESIQNTICSVFPYLSDESENYNCVSSEISFMLKQDYKANVIAKTTAGSCCQCMCVVCVFALAVAMLQSCEQQGRGSWSLKMASSSGLLEALLVKCCENTEWDKSKI